MPGGEQDGAVDDVGRHSDEGKGGSEAVEVVVVPAGQGPEEGGGSGVVADVERSGKVDDDNPKKLGLARSESTDEECRCSSRSSLFIVIYVLQ